MRRYFLFIFSLLLLQILCCNLLISQGWGLEVIEEYQYVENNSSDVDSRGEWGSHSNFIAQQSGPDGTVDSLTSDELAYVGSIDLYTDSFDGRWLEWTRIGAAPYLNTQNYPIDYVRLNADIRGNIGDFTFKDSERSNERIVSVFLKLYAWKGHHSDELQVNIWDGDSWGNKYTVNSTSPQWIELNVTSIFDTWTKIDNAKIFFYGDTRNSGDYPIFVDCALLRVNFEVKIYALDLEVQWTNATYDLPYEELGIFGGPMYPANLRVDVWNGSAWHILVTALSSGWNIISISDYLVGPIFTIRFVAGGVRIDAMETSPIYWDIDCTLLYVWGIPPDASLSVDPENSYTGEFVTFNASDSYDSDGFIVSYFWDYGDGTNGTSEVTTHSYVDDGAYTFLLTVTDDDGLSTVTTANITVENRPPIPWFTISSGAVRTGEFVTFNASDSYDSDGFIVSYFWDYGDGTNGTGEVVEHTYADNMTFDVLLIVEDDDGVEEVEVGTLTVYMRDLIILSVSLSSEKVVIGDFVNTTVSMKNGGLNSESFKVALYCNNTWVGEHSVDDLAPSANIDVVFSWNTSGFALGGYDIHVSVDQDAVQADQPYAQMEILPKSSSPNLLFVMVILLPLSFIGIFLGMKMRKQEGFKPVGFDFLDDLIGGGVPVGSMILLSGSPDSGMSLFCQQLVNKYLTEGKAGVFISCDEPPIKSRENMRGFGWDLSEYEKTGAFTFIDCYSSIVGAVSQEKHFLKPPLDLDELKYLMSEASTEMVDIPTAYFLDSASSLTGKVESKRVAEFLRDIKERVRNEKGIFVFTLNTQSFHPELTEQMEREADGIIEMANHEEKGRGLKKIRVKKLVGQEHSSDWVTFKVDRKSGVMFLQHQN